MSVTNLYCEGTSQSIDIRVIRALLPRGVVIHPLGGKTSSFVSSIIADRRRRPNLACLVDHDFDCRDWQIKNQPLRFEYDSRWIGWEWERKEIENYLIDPVVVRNALGNKAPDRDQYQDALDEAAKDIATYSAARTALACENFKNYWGDEVREGHLFPPQRGRNYCQVRIAEIVREYRGNRIVSEEDVKEKFRALLPKFRDGSRFQNYLHYFAGKDLLYVMRNTLRDFGFEDTSNNYHPEEVFIERVVTRIEKSTEEVWEWLPEWTVLRRLIEETDFSES